MVGPDAEIRGDINLIEGLIIYGKVYGSISSKGDVRIGKTGKVYGDIKAQNIHIGGEIFGNVTIEDRAELQQHKKCHFSRKNVAGSHDKANTGKS